MSSQGLKVYFDRNVFADICELRNDITEADVKSIESAVRSRKIIIPGSLPLFEETIAILKGYPEQHYTAHLEIVLGLISRSKMVKPVAFLLDEACYNYARGWKQESDL